MDRSYIFNGFNIHLSAETIEIIEKIEEGIITHEEIVKIILGEGYRSNVLNGELKNHKTQLQNIFSTLNSENSTVNDEIVSVFASIDSLSHLINCSPSKIDFNFINNTDINDKSELIVPTTFIADNNNNDNFRKFSSSSAFNDSIGDSDQVYQRQIISDSKVVKSLRTSVKIADQELQLQVGPAAAVDLIKIEKPQQKKKVSNKSTSTEEQIEEVKTEIANSTPAEDPIVPFDDSRPVTGYIPSGNKFVDFPNPNNPSTGIKPTDSIVLTVMSDDSRFENRQFTSDKRMKTKDDLQVFDNQANILITRTYRSAPMELSLREKISQSDNPLFELFQEFYDELPSVCRHRLLSASVDDNKLKDRIPDSNSVHQLLSAISANVVVVATDCEKMLIDVETCERIVGNLIILIKSTSDLKTNDIYSQLAELNSLFGRIEVSKIVSDLAMHEYRTVFERLQRSGISDSLLRESLELRKSYKLFLVCQGRLVEIQQRLLECRERSERYDLMHPELQVVNNNSNNNKRSTKNENKPNSNNHYNHNATEAEVFRLREMVDALEYDLQSAENDIVELQQEVFETAKDQDRTPGALLFFSVLSDPNYVVSLQQIVKQINHLKDFVNGAGHIDFVTLKKRVQVCAAICPSVEKVIDKYFSLYKRWSQSRLKHFNEHKLTGGDADSSTTCVLCNQFLSNNNNNNIDGLNASSAVFNNRTRKVLMRVPKK